jgi:enolase
VDVHDRRRVRPRRVPSGASTANARALELRDGDKTRISAKACAQAVANVNGEIAKALIGAELDQRASTTRMIALDGTAAKSRSARNALLGVSMARRRRRRPRRAAAVRTLAQLAGAQGSATRCRCR